MDDILFNYSTNQLVNTINLLRKSVKWVRPQKPESQRGIYFMAKLTSGPNPHCSGSCIARVFLIVWCNAIVLCACC